MNSSAFAIIGLICLFFIAESPAQIPFNLLTTPEKTNYDSTSSSDEVIQFLKAAASYSDKIHVDTLFTTAQGNTALYAILSKNGITTVQQAVQEDWPVVYLQGNIHAGEVEGKEALMQLIRDIIMGSKAYLLDHQIVLIAPNYNPDGNDKLSEMHRRSQEHCPHRVGTRRSGGDYDLNRDGVKTEAVETRGLFSNIILKWDPMLVVDMHTTNGTWHANHLTYAPSYHSAGHPATTEYTKNIFLPTVQKMMWQKHQLHTDSYGNYSLRDGWPPQKYYTYNHHPRYLVNQFGLRNRMAILSETFAHDKFYQRIQSAYNFALEILEFSNQNAQTIQSVNRGASAATIELIEKNAGIMQRGLRFEMMPDTLPFSLRTYDYIQYKDSLSKLNYLRLPTIIEIEELPYYSLFKPTKLATVPLGYCIPAHLESIVQQLKRLGIVVQELKSDTLLQGEKFIIESIDVAENAFEHHNMIQLEGKFRPSHLNARQGDYLVDMRQNLAFLIFYLLEPQSDDGLTRWNFMDKYLHKAGVLHHKVDYPVFKFW